MHPRALSRLLQLAPSERRDAIAAGLALLVEHVGTLGGDLAYLAKAKRPRAGAVLAALVEEEAAKVLILLDLVRMDPHDHQRARRQVAHYYNHLARCIYAEVAWMRPSHFGELRALIEPMRESHYLDGPTDTDWIFRNQLIARREDALYVDFVQEEDGHRWTTPAAGEITALLHATAAQDLVGALGRVGCTSRAGLDVVADAWLGHGVADGTHWQQAHRINSRIVEELHDRALVPVEATTNDITRVVEQWPFPLGGIDLKGIKVPLPELHAERTRRQYGGLE